MSLTGDSGQPLTRAHLAEAIGEHGQVHDSADAYRTTVRRTLYAGLTEQRYDSLTALRQLRTPKLSERLDPGLLSDLLSSALPPLGEGEIHEIAEGFERLDRQREELRRLDEHVGEADRLAARQRTYAQRVLHAAAAHLISAKRAMAKLTAEAARAVRTTSRRTPNATGQPRPWRGGASGRTARRPNRGLKESDAYRQGRELDKLRDDTRKAEVAAAQARREAERHADEAARKRADAEQARADASTRRDLTRHAGREAARAAHRAGLAAAVHEEAVRTAIPAEEPADPSAAPAAAEPDAPRANTGDTSEEAGGTPAQAGGALAEAGGTSAQTGGTPGAQGRPGRLVGRSRPQDICADRRDAREAGGTPAQADGASGQAGGTLAEAGGTSTRIGGTSGEAGGTSAQTGGMPGEAGGARAEGGGVPVEAGIERARELLRAASRSRERQIADLRAAIGRHAAAVKRRTEAEEDRDASRTRLDEATGKREEAREVFAEARETLAAELVRWARRCVHLTFPDPEALVQTVEDERECDALVVAAKSRRPNVLRRPGPSWTAAAPPSRRG